MLTGIVERLSRWYYKNKLYRKMGKKAKNVSVKGKLSFENGSVEIGENCILYPDVSFAGNGKIQIGNNCKIGSHVILYANKNGGVSIGDNTIIAAQTYIIDSNHGTDAGELIQKQPLQASKVTIGSDCWIGADVTIIKGAVIEDGAVIGAKSLVNSRIEKNGIAFGIPAKVNGRYRKE